MLAIVAAAFSLIYASAANAEFDMIGELEEYGVVGDETLLDVAVRNDLGFIELLAANPGIDRWSPGPGVSIVLPKAHLLPAAPRRGIVVNLADQRLYYFSDVSMPPTSFPVGIGRRGYETPLKESRIKRKREKPTWTPPPSIRAERPDLPAAIPPGPDNPLGEFALDLDLDLDGYVIHGTNLPYGVGRRVSHGCIRLYPGDIARLFAEVDVGTPVAIVDQPAKLGWVDGELYLEVHPSQSQADELEALGRFAPEPIPDLEARIHDAAGAEIGRLDWSAIRRVAHERRGIPVRITH